tara:strand:+ start:1503 stop:2087 length:585 start_codon:yes stop_codon:yes gene_type:complete
MITDRISLNLAYIYLKRVEANEGPIQDIILSYKHFKNDSTNTIPRFSNLTDLWNFIGSETSPGGFEKIHCLNLGIYELKSFLIDKDKSSNVKEKSNFLVKRKEGAGFVTNGAISKATTRDLDVGYIPRFDEVYKKWKEMIQNEYINIQEDYIDCGYIEVYFKDAIDGLKKLYNKYRFGRKIITRELYNKNIRKI